MRYTSTTPTPNAPRSPPSPGRGTRTTLKSTSQLEALATARLKLNTYSTRDNVERAANVIATAPWTSLVRVITNSRVFFRVRTQG
jgi:hypothetical protein